MYTIDIMMNMEKLIEPEGKIDVEESIDSLISEFPKGLQDRLWSDTENMNSQTAHDYLVAKLIERNNTLADHELLDIPSSVEILTEHPQGLVESLKLSEGRRSEYFLGNGQNGEVFASTRREGVCYKTLFLERAKIMGANIAKETFMQHKAVELLNDKEGVAHVPKVYGYVTSDTLKAIKMEKIEGHSFTDVFKGERLPKNFDIDSFFEKLKKACEILNEHGYFHRDIANNAGNIFVGEDGDPYIIDFGSTIKSAEVDVNPNGYQLVHGGIHYHANDIPGVLGLKQKVQTYLNNLQV